MKQTKAWWDDFFCDDFANLLLERSEPEKLQQDIDFIVKELQLTPGDLVFDQCCGTGEIACGLAKKGMSIIGVDQAESYIQRATTKAQSQSLPCEFYCNDAFTFICERPVKAALNWYTSFGYSAEDQINLKMLKNSYDSLEVGGRFILDYTNPAFIFRHFTEHQELKVPSLNGEIIVYKQSSVDLEKGLFISSWRYVTEGKEDVVKSGQSRIYMPKELITMLESCGFKILSLKGNSFGDALSKDSPRCIITAQK
jgi:SAM-dependent methyltransferase